MLYYLDTNILYAATQTIYSQSCQQVLDLIVHEKITGVTSVETIQEVIFLGQKQKTTPQFVNVAQSIISLVNPLPVDDLVINEYVKLARKYPQVISRYLLHIATCKIQSIDNIISLDRELDILKDENVIRLTPANILSGV